MSNSQGGAGNSLGLAVGATNLACTGDGQRAVVRPAAVAVSPGLTLTGFVDRVGDPVPMIAADGSAHRPEMLLTEALDRLARSAAVAPVSDVAVAVPAHWRPAMVEALRDALSTKPGLTRAPLVSDATAALTALRANPGLPSTGVIALCDFGGSGAGITLVDAAAQDAPIGETVRVPDFSGDQIDQAVLTKVVADLLEASDADPAGTAMVGSLARLRDECRRAKERLSEETATAIAVDVPGLQTTVRLTRMELEDLIDAPLAGFTAALADTLERNRVPSASVSAVATVGGGARIPLITQRLSEQLRTRVVTTTHPQLTVADGAALIGHRSQVVETATAMAPAAPATATVAAAAFAAGGAAVGALAWSEVDDDDLMAVAPHLEPDYVAGTVDSRPEVNFRHDESDGLTPARRRSPALLFGLAGAAVAVAAAVFGLTAFTHDTPTVPAGTAADIARTAPAPAPAAKDSVATAQEAQAPAPAPAAPTVVSQPQRVARQQEAPAAPAAPADDAPAPQAPAPAPAPEAPAPAPAPAPEAPAPAPETPAPAPENPAPATPWTPPWVPPWHSTPGTGGTPGADTGGGSTGSSDAGTGGAGTGANTGPGTGAHSGTGSGTGSGASTGGGDSSTGSGGAAKTPPALGGIPLIAP